MECRVLTVVERGSIRLSMVTWLSLDSHPYLSVPTWLLGRGEHEGTGLYMAVLKEGWEQEGRGLQSVRGMGETNVSKGQE